MTTSSTDRIEKKVLLRAPRSRVFRALTNAKEFGSWFGVDLRGGDFEPGMKARGPVTHPGYTHMEWEVTIDTIEPERYLSWRWHPYAIDPSRDYSAEPFTLVEFTLEEVEGGTLLTVVESGFDKLPLSRRTEAYRSNDDGWRQQMENIEKHVDASR